MRAYRHALPRWREVRWRCKRAQRLPHAHHLRACPQVMTSDQAATLTHSLARAAPVIEWRAGVDQPSRSAAVGAGAQVSGHLRLTGWEDCSGELPDLTQTRVACLTVQGAYAAANDGRYYAQLRGFRRSACCGLQDVVSERLVVPGFTDSHQYRDAAHAHTAAGSSLVTTLAVPEMRVLVTRAGERPPSLVHPACFWACQISVVFALPYRLWFARVVPRLTHVVAKKVFCL